jgi:DNA modification methylase
MSGVELTPYYADTWLTVYEGDCRSVMAEMEPESVHCVVTSPPYWGLRDYGTPGQLGLEPTPEEYVANMVAVFREVRRVLRADGTVWLNLGDSYASSPPGNGKGFTPESTGLHGGRTSARYQATMDAGSGTKRNTVVAGLKPKDLVGIPWRVAFALQADGWYLRSDIIWSKPNPMPESVTDRPTKAHEYLFLLSKAPRYYFDADAVRETDAGTDHRHRNVLDGQPSLEPSGGLAGAHRGLRTVEGRNGAGRNLRSVWTVATQPYPGAHFATFPEALVEPCVKAGSPYDGVILDPFAGSGTTGKVAQRLGRRAVLIDLNGEYLKQAMARNADIPLGLGA